MHLRIVPNAVLLTGLAVLVVMLGFRPAVTAAQAGERPASQVLIEGGLAVPFGELGDDFEQTRLGFGAENGYVAGFRYRIHLSPTVSVSPSFHFVDFGNFDGVHPDVDEYRIQSSSLRYAVEFMVISRFRSYGKPRCFLAAGIGLYRNRVQGFYQDYIEAIDKSVSTLGASFRWGVQIIGFELSLVYNINRFNTWQFHQSDYRERYNWDNLEVRVGWLIPFQ